MQFFLIKSDSFDPNDDIQELFKFFIINNAGQNVSYLNDRNKSINIHLQLEIWNGPMLNSKIN